MAVALRSSSVVEVLWNHRVPRSPAPPSHGGINGNRSAGPRCPAGQPRRGRCVADHRRDQGRDRARQAWSRRWCERGPGRAVRSRRPAPQARAVHDHWRWAGPDRRGDGSGARGVNGAAAPADARAPHLQHLDHRPERSGCVRGRLRRVRDPRRAQVHPAGVGDTGPGPRALQQARAVVRPGARCRR